MSLSPEYIRIHTKYPFKIPIILERIGPNAPELVHTKYLVNQDFTLGEFLYMIRMKSKLRPEFAIFLFINQKVYNTSECLQKIYDAEKRTDGFLYISVSSENTFGG
jgi:GABA(A) receptor-associated protein